MSIRTRKAVLVLSDGDDESDHRGSQHALSWQMDTIRTTPGVSVAPVST